MNKREMELFPEGRDHRDTLFAAYFDAIASAPLTEGIEAAEQSWMGGVADFGDPEAAHCIQGMTGYFDYRSHLENAAFQHLGDTFVVFRLMSEEQFGAWRNGDDVGPIAVTASFAFASSFARFAGFQDDQSPLGVYRIVATPPAIIMRGKVEEYELVLDANTISAEDVQLLEVVSGKGACVSG